MGAHGGKEEEPPPIAPYPFWQQGLRRSPQPLRRSAPPPPVDTYGVTYGDDVYDQSAADVPTVAHDVSLISRPADAPSPDLLNGLHRQKDGDLAEVPPRGRPARGLLLGFTGALIVLVVIAFLVVTGGGDDATTSGSTKPTGPPGPTTPSFPRGTAPADLAPMAPADATAALASARVRVAGDVVEALTWTDKAGRSAVVTTALAAKGHTELRVSLVSGLGAKPKEERTMRDPDLPVCAGGGTGSAGFTPGALVVRDLDGDGVAEVVSGWSSRCTATVQTSTVRLALLSGGDKYIIRGTGRIGADAPEAGGSGAGTAVPDPAVKSWPATWLATLTAFYHALYY